MSTGYVVHDRQRRTALVVDKVEGQVKFIPLSYEFGLQVESLPSKEFEQLYQEMPDYPIERAAALYVGYSHSIGASKEALDYLGQIIKLSAKDIEMATKKPAAKAAPAKKTAAAKKAPASKKPAAKKEPGERKPSAAARFKELIMEGKKTDDQIFAVVQKEFNLDDNKRSYVAWYRNDLTKKGFKPPKAKE